MRACVYVCNSTDPVQHVSKSPLSIANKSHTMVYTARTQATLSYFKATTFSEQNVGGWHPYILKYNFTVTFC